MMEDQFNYQSNNGLLDHNERRYDKGKGGRKEEQCEMAYNE